MAKKGDTSRTEQKRTTEMKKQVLIALEKSLGVVKTACDFVGVTRKQFYSWCDTDSEFRKAVDDVQEIALDFVETAFLKKIKEGDTQCILYYMKTKGGKRGYTDRHHIEHSGEGVVVQVTDKILAQEITKAIND